MNPPHRQQAILTATLMFLTGLSASPGVTIDTVYFGQPHLQEVTHPYFNLGGNRDTLIKAHVVDPDGVAAPPVQAVLTLDGEWVLGGDPSDGGDDDGLAPTLDNTSDPDFLILNFNRADAANDDPDTTIIVEYGSDLSAWTAAVDDSNNIIITETPGTPTAAVEVKIRRTLATDGKLFARLRVVVASAPN